MERSLNRYPLLAAIALSVSCTGPSRTISDEVYSEVNDVLDVRGDEVYSEVNGVLKVGRIEAPRMEIFSIAEEEFGESPQNIDNFYPVGGAENTSTGGNSNCGADGQPWFPPQERPLQPKRKRTYSAQGGPDPLKSFKSQISLRELDEVR